MKGGEDFPFYASLQGTIDLHPDGEHILVGDPEAGRIFEVDRKNRISWLYPHVIGRHENNFLQGRVVEARYVSRENLSFTQKACPESASP